LLARQGKNRQDVDMSQKRTRSLLRKVSGTLRTSKKRSILQRWRSSRRVMQQLAQRRNLRTIVRVAIPILLIAGIGRSHVALAVDPVEPGRILFEHKWSPGDPLSPYGDGLGPMHNADSCVACHSLGGIGGSGSAEHNVSVLSLAIPKGKSSTRERRSFRSHAGTVNPAFFGPNAASSVVLHHFSTEPRYERWRLGILGIKLPAQAEPSRVAVASLAAEQQRSSLPPVADLPRKNGVPLQLSQRNTPALFGAGLIDAIPEKTLLKLAQDQAERFPGIAGRVGRTADGGVGRFGWRGQVATLRDFVLTACSMELGLQSATHPQAANPLDPHKSAGGYDLSRRQCDAIVAFVASLPAPRQLAPESAYDAELVSHGAKLFDAIGCGACHVRDVGNVIGLFSDLLLHDMGPGLEDPIPASPQHRPAFASNMVSGNFAYSGGGLDTLDVVIEVPPRLRREWKTPPLWGVRDSAPYLHDGRARTLDQAIAAHGGEAERSAKKFAGFNYEERTRLVMFLNSLAGPALPSANLGQQKNGN
jgi:CxxC motif-containing protein (DUF1111 family)